MGRSHQVRDSHNQIICPEPQAAPTNNIATQRARTINEHFARGSTSSAIPGLNSPTARRPQLLPSLPRLLQPPHRSRRRPPSPTLLPISVPHNRRPSPLPLPKLPRRRRTQLPLSLPPSTKAPLTPRRSPTNLLSPPPPPAMWSPSQPVLIATAHSPHLSAWSLTCGYISQCLKHQHTLAASATTVLTVREHSSTA
ncbi:hypothetical protein SprV_0401623600 [Sparganum proliferum]